MNYFEIKLNDKKVYLEKDTIRCIKESECEYCSKFFEKQNIVKINDINRIRTLCNKCLTKCEKSVTILPIDELFLLLAAIENI